MYLEHFQFQSHPFSLTPNVKFFCNLPVHQAALNVLLFGLGTGEGFIKVVGEVGSGKTMLCRLLLNELKEPYVTIFIPNPDLDPMALKIALALELGIDNASSNPADLMQQINQKLLSLHAEGKKPVVMIDEAQAIPDGSLETLRLFTNLETESSKLLQIVLFAQPEFEARLKRYEFRQLQQRITFAHYLAPIKEKDLEGYLCHRLATAGYTKGLLFDRKACKLLYKASQGTPRIINILCHKALLVAYGLGLPKVDAHCMQVAIDDSKETVRSVPRNTAQNWVLPGLIVLLILVLVGAFLTIAYT